MVLVDIFLVLSIGELQKLMELLELEVGLVEVETEVNTGTPLTVKEDLTIKVVAVVLVAMVITTLLLLQVELPTQVVVAVEDQVIILVEETKEDSMVEMEDLVLFLSDIKINYHAQQTKVSLTPLLSLIHI